MAGKITRPFGLSVHQSDLTEEFFAACREADVYSVEMSLSVPQYPSLDWVSVSEMIRRNGLIINSVHLPFSRTMSISHPEKENRDASMELNESVMRAAAACGVKIAVVHPSTEPNAEEDRPRIMGYAKENLKILAELGAELDMVVAVEDLPRTCLGRDAADMLELLSADSRLRACFDTN